MGENELSPSKLRSMCLKLVQAMNHIHEQGVLLRNFNSFNILMSQTKEFEEKDAIPRICNLQKAQVVGFDGNSLEMEGDLRYLAPEVIKGKRYSFPADVWSMGVVIFYILTKKHPFEFPT